MCLFSPIARMDLGGTLRDPKFDPNFDHLDPFEGPGGKAAASPVQAAFGLEDLFGSLKPMPGTPNFGHFDHFDLPETLENDPILDHLAL